MCFDVTVEVIGNEIVVSVISDGVAECAETAGVAKSAAFDRVKNIGQVRVKSKGAEIVSVAKVFNILGQVTKKKDIGVTDFTCYFDLVLINM